MDPVLEPTTYVFVTLDDEQLNHHLADCLMVFREREGTTLIMEQCKADSRGLDSSFPCKRITLQIHSALEAVGFLAAVIPSLAGAGMGVNPVSAFFHDHLFVPADRAEEAVQLLRQFGGKS